MDFIKNIKFKDLTVFIPYHFGSEILKGISNKVELFMLLLVFRNNWEVFLQIEVGGVSVVKNSSNCEAL